MIYSYNRLWKLLIDKRITKTQIRLVLNEDEAKIVCRIYDLFLQGRSPYAIAKVLTSEGIPTPGDKKVWGKAPQGLVDLGAVVGGEDVDGQFSLFLHSFLGKI